MQWLLLCSIALSIITLFAIVLLMVSVQRIDRGAITIPAPLSSEPFRTVYVPIPAALKPHEELWKDIEYLNGVSELRNDKRYMGEVSESVKRLREALDTSQPADYPGLKKGLEEAKRLLTISAYADSKISELRYEKKLQKQIADTQKAEDEANDFRAG